ncbi:MAG: cell division protein FtsZ [Bacteroidaceae bacterium]|nr:cell division protein FtsZ [Bacteroidaceae bacterium]MBO5951557.1 cell division protein FtsZ [Bacteroidaceae bacterium]
MNESIKNFEEKEVLDFGFPTSVENIIKVIGVGGGGSNAVENMYRQGIHDVGFVLANTDHQALNKTEIPIKIQLGKTVTNGLGAGNDPEVAKRAAEESKDDIELQFKDGTKMVFITAGMGGGTGTGAAPVIAKYAKEAGMLTVGIVTIPFKFEQRPKIKQALAGVKEMAKQVDALLVISNEKLLEMYPQQSVAEGFKKVDETLTIATKSIAELITVRGTINLDFHDVSKILKNGGVAIMSTGKASGQNRVNKALEEALNSPLLYNNDIYNSKKILFNIYESKTNPLIIKEMNEVREFMDKFENGGEIELIWGLAQDPELEDEVKITVLATGFGMENIPFMVENPENDMIDAIYGRDICWYELKDDDLDNDALLDVLSTVPAYQRDNNGLQKIRSCRR